MATIKRTKSETVATVTSAVRKISVAVTTSLTVEESKELRKLLKAEEATASKQSTLLGSYFNYTFPSATWTHGL